MTLYTELRLDFIDYHLATHGAVQRADIMMAFGVSPGQASADLKAFMAAHRDAIKYDLNAKAYRPRKQPYVPQRPWTTNPDWLAANALLVKAGHPLGWPGQPLAIAAE